MSPLGAVEAQAVELAGNWQRFNSFMAGRQLTELAMGHQWAVVYTSNRDADALTRSNARIIARELAPFLRHGRDIQEASSSHWACGHVDGYVVRVYTPCRRLTRAFQALATMLVAIEDYPALDEDDWSQEESDDAAACWASMSISERIEHLRKYCAGPYDSVRDAMHVGSFSELLRALRNGTHAPWTSSGYEGLTGY